MLLGIDHCNISTRDMAATLGFYERILGLRAKAAPGQEAERNSWLYDAAGNALVHVNLRPFANEDGPVNHIAFACDDYVGMRARLLEVGCEIIEIDNRTVTGCRQIFTRGPEGARIELNFREA